MTAAALETPAREFSPDALTQFTGTSQWYRHGLVPGVTYTDGVRYVAETAGAYWLLDKIATAQLAEPHRSEAFQVWTLEVRERRASLICTDGDDTQISIEEITFTDFPEPGLTLWFTDNVLLLPSEY